MEREGGGWGRTRAFLLIKKSTRRIECNEAKVNLTKDPLQGYLDELAWAAAWLYKATNTSSYLTDAQVRSLSFQDPAALPKNIHIDYMSITAPAGHSALCSGWLRNAKLLLAVEMLGSRLVRKCG